MDGNKNFNKMYLPPKLILITIVLYVLPHTWKVGGERIREIKILTCKQLPWGSSIYRPWTYIMDFWGYSLQNPPYTPQFHQVDAGQSRISSAVLQGRLQTMHSKPLCVTGLSSGWKPNQSHRLCHHGTGSYWRKNSNWIRIPKSYIDFSKWFHNDSLLSFITIWW